MVYLCIDQHSLLLSISWHAFRLLLAKNLRRTQSSKSARRIFGAFLPPVSEKILFRELADAVDALLNSPPTDAKGLGFSIKQAVRKNLCGEEALFTILMTARLKQLSMLHDQAGPQLLATWNLAGFLTKRSIVRRNTKLDAGLVEAGEDLARLTIGNRPGIPEGVPLPQFQAPPAGNVLLVSNRVNTRKFDHADFGALQRLLFSDEDIQVGSLDCKQPVGLVKTLVSLGMIVIVDTSENDDAIDTSSHTEL